MEKLKETWVFWVLGVILALVIALGVSMFFPRCITYDYGAEGIQKSCRQVEWGGTRHWYE